ncbi:Ldh family oxidoreductase [Actinokineospora iranica]|uniref:Malate/lactate/ureidoglycolate dehydrogenase, LDH2 family n=1 Tax=Actinokineospora iranica TaxID=1271860 RepID=A0A1G6MET3_9PSEU|nr:Ldh family oxidoreductase [Actinokineospora iranica]SDC53475.1 Malate/lactate/ureidoglycolate dehydrogenase, LDH2 family [Actinokineospora iranica]
MTDLDTAPRTRVRVPHDDLLGFTAAVFAAHGATRARARTAAEALCHGDITGTTSHGLVNLTRIYLPLLASGRGSAETEPRVLADRGASVLLDGRGALGLWLAAEAMDLAAGRAAEHGIGLVSVRGGTHFGCAGFHALRAVARGMIGVVASNCGHQRIARPPGGLVPMLGTNPLSVAAPAGEHPPFVLDMSTTAVPTGKVRAAARAGRDIPAGWLADDRGAPVTDPTRFDRGEAHLTWLGAPGSGEYKGFGLGLMVEVLAALVPGSGLGPSPAALTGTRPAGGTGRHASRAADASGVPGDGNACGATANLARRSADDDIGYLVLAVAPAALRDPDSYHYDAGALFGSLLGCPPVEPGGTVAYPGVPEARHAEEARRYGVPLSAALHAELGAVADRLNLRLPGAC